MSEYFYSITTSFPNSFNPATDSGELSLQIANDQSITTFLLSIGPDPNNSDLIIIESTLADDQALQLLSSNTYGGILMQSGFGGIEVITTNSFAVTAAAASGIVTSLGNVTLEATAALVNIDGGAGVNVGSGSFATPVNIGTGSQQHVVTIGNNVSASAVAIAAGSGGVSANSNATISLNATGAASNLSVNTNADAQDLTLAVIGATNSSIILSSQGTGTDAISLISNGGITLFSQSANNYPINIVSNTAIANAINLDCSSTGGIIMAAGPFGININAYNGGTVGVGNFNGGDIYFSTAAAARNIFFGTDSAATVFYQRFGKGQLGYQPAPTDLATASSPLTMAELSTRLLFGTPSSTVTVTLPTPVLFVTYFPSVIIGDSLDFSVVNQSATPGDIYTLDAGSQATVGNVSVAPGVSAQFRIRMTNITFPTQAYTLYRIA